MMKHSDYITHIKNHEDLIYLKSKHFPVNMRLFETSTHYRSLIQAQCRYIQQMCLTEKEGYKKPHGMSSANVGLAFNIIGITVKARRSIKEWCRIMINPFIIETQGKQELTTTNCGSLTLKNPIRVWRRSQIRVDYFDTDGNHQCNWFTKEEGAYTIQHEIDHNNGILITDRE